jgi:hypothetical protein
MDTRPTVQFTVGNGFDLAGLDALISASNRLHPQRPNISAVFSPRKEPVTIEGKIESIVNYPDRGFFEVITMAPGRRNFLVSYKVYGDQACVYRIQEGSIPFIHIWIGIRDQRAIESLWRFQPEDKHFYPRPWRRCRELGIRTMLDISRNLDRFINPHIAHYMQYKKDQLPRQKLSPAPRFRPKTTFHILDYTGGKSCFEVMMDAIHFVISAALQNTHTVITLDRTKNTRWHTEAFSDMFLTVRFPSAPEKNGLQLFYFSRASISGAQGSLHKPATEIKFERAYEFPDPIPNEIELEFQSPSDNLTKIELKVHYDEQNGMREIGEKGTAGLMLGASMLEIVQMVDQSRLDELTARVGPKRRNPTLEAERIGGNVLSVFNSMSNIGPIARMSPEEKTHALSHWRGVSGTRWELMSDEEKKDKRISYHPISYLGGSSTSVTIDHNLEIWNEGVFNGQRALADQRWVERNRMLVDSIQRALGGEVPSSSSSSSSSSRESNDPFPLL